MPLSTQILPRRRAVLAAVCSAALAGCASLVRADPPVVDIVGVDPLPGEGAELRLGLHLRVQNPSDFLIEYDGVAIELLLNGHRFASGVSNQSGTIARYSEAIIIVPVSVPPFAMVRAALGLARGDSLSNIPYTVTGKLSGSFSGSAFDTLRFESRGMLDLPGY
jgi:LEA14-like dessication related protein